MTDPLSRGNTNPQRGGKKPLPHGWIVLPSKSFPDRVYYFNTATRCSTWENPCDSNDSPIQLKTPEKRKSNYFQSNPSTSKIHPGSISSISNRSLEDDSSMVIDQDIEDYDEAHNDYFDNVPMNTFSLRRTSISSPPNSPEEIMPKRKNMPASKIIANEPKELWTWFQNASVPKTNQPKKSLVLSDCDKTIKNMKIVQAKKPEEKKVIRSKVLSESSTPAQSRLMKIRQANINSVKSPPIKDALRFSKSEKNDQKFKKTVEVPAMPKRIPKLSKVLEKQVDEVKSSSPLCDIYKLSATTPAQSRLMKIRQGIAETAKKNLKPSKVLLPSSNDKSTSLQDRFQRKRKEFEKSEVNSKPNEQSNYGADWKKKKKIHFVGETRAEYVPTEPIIGTPFNQDQEEEMEWEPCDEQEMIDHIKELRKTLSTEEELQSLIVIKDQNMDSKTESLSWIIVLDTNILLSSLNFIKDLRDTKINDVGYPIIYIPWRVLQELDHLKDSPQLKVSARRAISYINENFISSHPRFRGQSFQEFSEMSKSESELPDDDILQTCFNVQKEHKDKNLILLTNDKNLETKAILSSIKSYSKERFQKEMGFSKDKSVVVNNSHVRNNNNNNNNNNDSDCIPSTFAVGSKTVDENDKMICKLKAILKNLLVYVVETELKLAFGDDWKKIAKPQDWTLVDLINGFIKYWRSVFHFVFPKQTLERIENLKKAFQNKNLGQKDEVKSTVIVSQELLVYIKRCKEIRPYMDLVDTSLKDLNLLLNPNLPAAKEVPQNPLLNLTIKTEPVDAVDPEDCDKESHIEKIRSIFREIWNFVRNFWSTLKSCLLSIESKQPYDKAVLSTIKSEVPAVCKNLQDLIESLEEVTKGDIYFFDVSKTHKQITELSEVLVKFGTSINPSFADIYLGDDLSLSLSIFCGDRSGRTLLETSLSDFKEFLNELVKFYEYLQNMS